MEVIFAPENYVVWVCRERVSVTLLPSVHNSRSSEIFEHRFFLSPFFLLLALRRGQSSDFVVEAQVFDQNVDSQVIEMLEKSRPGLPVYNLHQLRLHRMQIKIANFPGAEITDGEFPREEDGGVISVPDTLPLSIKVLPSTQKDLFERTFKAGEITFTMNIEYSAGESTTASLEWDSDSFRCHVENGDINTNGGQFVTAQEREEIVMKETRLRLGRISIDTGMEYQVKKLALDLFEMCVKNTEDDHVLTLNELRQIDEEIGRRRGHVDLNKFFPIVSMWNIANEVKGVRSKEEANSKMQESLKQSASNEDFEINAKAAYGMISGGGKYGKRMSKDNIEKGYFSNETELSDWHAFFNTASGESPVITPRGLDLVRREQFLATLTSAVNIRAVSNSPESLKRLVCIARYARLYISPRSSIVRQCLNVGDVLLPGDYIKSPNQLYTLTLTEQGELLLVKGTSEPIFSSGTVSANHRPTTVRFLDGNLVLEDVGGIIRWSSSTNCDHPRQMKLEVQDDGRAVIRGPLNIVWTTGGRVTKDFLFAGDTEDEDSPINRLGRGEMLVSANGGYRLHMQKDSNVVLYQGGRSVWESRTLGSGGESIKLRADGRITLHNSAGNEVRQILNPLPKVTNKNSVMARLQPDGKLVVYELRPLWSSW